MPSKPTTYVYSENVKVKATQMTLGVQTYNIPFVKNDTELQIWLKFYVLNVKY
jgi:hypothetical protein